MLDRSAILKNIAFTFFMVFFSSAFGGWKTPRESLNNQVVFGDYKVFFAIGGKHSFILERKYTQAEENKLQLKLQALDKQIKSADNIYSNGLNLSSPLTSRRYSNVEAIHLHVMDMGERNGSAGDAENTFSYNFFDNSELALILSLTTRWEPPNRTPEHEVFHLYQYGYTFFKNAWFLEGLAASMENHFSLGEWDSSPLPETKRELNKLLTRSYSAKNFWNRLVLMCDPGCNETVSTCGQSLVKPLFEEYARQDLVAAKVRGLNSNNWPEKEQKSVENNIYLLNGLRSTLNENCPVNSEPELKSFLTLLNEILDIKNMK